jgi:uncharacterized protein YndB with AHSA1/START domain
MKRDLRFEAVYPYPPERLWRALTSRDELKHWLMDNDFEARTGHKFQFRGKARPNFDGVVDCEVIELEQPRRIAYRWVSGSLNTVVRFQLELAENGGTRVILEHMGFESTGDTMISALVAWNRMLREALPETISGIPVSTVRCNVDIVNALVERYERGASVFADLLALVPAESIDLVPVEGEWSVRQTALHIVDAEIVGAMRLRLLAAQPGSKLTAYAGNIWARELGYARQPLEPALELFQALRYATSEILRRLPVSAWSNRGEHEESGELTLEALLDSHCEHAEAHLSDLATLVQKLNAELRTEA